MPLFFLLSGLFAEHRADRGASSFVRDKLATVAYPYLVWSLIQTLMQFATSRYINSEPDLYALTRILADPIMQFWFLYALFLISLMYYTLRRCGLGPLGVLTVFTAFWSTQGWLSLGTYAPLYTVRWYGIYYALGPVLKRSGVADGVGRAPVTALASASVLGYGVVTLSAARPQVNLPLSLAVALCGIAASVALAVLLSRAGGMDFIRVLGTYSLEIYVAHTIASAGLRIALQKVLRVQDVTTHILFGTIGGLALPVILGRLCRRYHAEFLFRLKR
jgi:fucose 4-O-acetylase-like acetyltransferase